MTIGAASYLIGFLAILFLDGLLLTSWRGSVRGRWIILASSVTAIWCALLGIQEQFHIFPARFIWTAEVARSFGWLLFFGRLLNSAHPKNPDAKLIGSGPIKTSIWAAGICQLIYVWVSPYLEERFPEIFHPIYPLLGFILLALFGFFLIEQYFRNTRTDLRWRIKFLCLGLGAMFAYDFYLYADGMMFQQINPDVWAARGAIWVMLTPLLAVSAARNPDWSVDIFVSREVVFHSATLLSAGVYLLLMATAGYSIKLHGGEWGAVVQIVFLVGAFVVLAILLFSGQMRARMRVFLSKNFFNYAYDYREEWLRIINTLSDTRSELTLEQRIIVALGQAVESPSGILWVRQQNGNFGFRASFGEPGFELSQIAGDDPAVRYMAHHEWIINLEEVVTMPEAYHGLNRPAWLGNFNTGWLLVPLLEPERQLKGIMLLSKPRTPIHWNWEVIDLLKTSSRLAASYLALEDAGKELTEARQFEGFNRLSAFVIHDLKNLIAQLSLVVRNAERHRNNPEFMHDAIKTVDHATTKMSRLMSQLRNLGAGQAIGEFDLAGLLREVVASRKDQLPVPELAPVIGTVPVKANRDRLGSALEHVIHNAQDAAGKNGRVRIRLRADHDRQTVVEVEDNGHGMDAEFIRSRLFRPFDTTKGLTGMGIGAYESREYIRSLGGELMVASEPEKGSTFTFVIPNVPASGDQPVPMNEVQST